MIGQTHRQVERQNSDTTQALSCLSTEFDFIIIIIVSFYNKGNAKNMRCIVLYCMTWETQQTG